jgi:hypothetical protein
MAKVTAPVEGYTGTGPGGVEFKDGVAETDDKGLLGYFSRKGYGIDGKAAEPGDPYRDDAVEPDAELGDDVRTLGTPLRDAAVDPREEDFLPPTSAGEAHPHGRKVVSPGIHASAPGPIAPGDVSKDAKEQEAKETELATAVFVERQDVPEATRATARRGRKATVEGEPGGASARAANGTSDTTAPTRTVAKKSATKADAAKSAPSAGDRPAAEK